MRISDWSSDVCSSDLSLGDPWADTTTPHGRLMLTVLGGLAEFERELIVTRTGEGRARAVARGQHMGRPPMLTAHQRTEARSEEHTSELQSLMRISYAVFCLKKKTHKYTSILHPPH